MSNELSKLVRDRMAERGLTYGDVSAEAKRKGHSIARATVHEIANKPERRHAPHASTLKALAAGLSYPYDVLAEAAARSAGYRIQDVTTTLQSAGTLRIIAAVHEELSEDEQSKLAEMAERYAAELKAKRRAAGSG